MAADTVPSASDYEKLGLFYLGRGVDGPAGEPTGAPLLYDSRNLTTHAVCLGMTGSGKTGLCLSLLEEAAIDGVPAIAIDPKGDVGDLLLTFPELKPEDFEPWVDDGEARRRGIPVAELAKETADTWRQGLAKWGEGPDRIARLRSSADLRIYTPGSTAGTPVSVLSSLAAPGAELVADGDLLRDRVATVATSLLTLLGRDADPVQSREHILLSKIFDDAWRAGRDLDLATLIRSIQEPPFQRVGVMDLESFFPSKDRFGLAMALNNLLASPGFAPWLQGESLDPGKLLYTAEGKPRIAILSIAHLSEAERMFFVTLLLSETIAWMRRSSGTSSLRAILYMDEVFGFLPPVAEPPSKRPFLTLLKQARAYGLGLVLATQNPVDLDYKGLSNAGTWFLGRLQTERDRDRVVDGLVSATGEGLDRGELAKTIGGLGKRTFVLHDVHGGAPTLFRTRWALSYLAGPLTRDDISRLTPEAEAASAPAPASDTAGSEASPAPAKPAAAPAAPAPPAPAAASPPAADESRPILPDGVPEGFLPPAAGATTGAGAAGAAGAVEPALLGLARLRFVEAKRDVDHEEAVALVAAFTDSVRAIDWREARDLGIGEHDVLSEPASEPGSWSPLPEKALRPASYSGWSKELADTLYQTRRLSLWRCAAVDALSKPGEEERDFRIRVRDLVRQERDRRLADLEKEYGERLEKIEARLQKAQDRQEREAAQVRQQTLNTGISLAATLGAALFGRKALSRSTLGRATTAMRGVGRVRKESAEAEQAKEKVETIQAEHDALLEEKGKAAASLGQELDGAAETLETVEVKPRRQDVEVRWVGLTWVPPGYLSTQ